MIMAMIRINMLPNFLSAFRGFPQLEHLADPSGFIVPHFSQKGTCKPSRFHGKITADLDNSSYLMAPSFTMGPEPFLSFNL
jgi:hypothetical protein